MTPINLLLTAFFSAWGQQNYTPASFRDFTGGLNDNTPAHYLRSNESPRAANVVVDEPVGALRPRKGSSLCGNLPSGLTPTALYEFFKSDGTRRLIVSDNSNYYQTADCTSFTTIKDGLISTARPTFVTARDKLWVTNRSTHVFTWDGSTTTILDGRSGTPNPAPPRCQYLEFWKERVWCARSDSNASGIAFSALTDTAGGSIDPSTGSASWPAANLIQVDQNGGSAVYGIRAFRDSLYVFKNNGIWRILFEDEFNVSVVKTFSSVGTRFHESIIELDNLLYFVGPDGIYAFDGDQSVRISDNIYNLFSSFNQPLVNNQFKTWTSQGDFDGGSPLTQVDTDSTVNSLLLGTTVMAESNYTDPNSGLYPAQSSFTSQGFGWKIHAGTVQIADGKVKSQATGNPIVSTSIEEPNFAAQTGRKYAIKMNHTSGNPPVNVTDFVFISNSTTTLTNGYAIRYTNDGRFQLLRYASGSPTVILNAAASYPALDSDPSFHVTMSSTGVFVLYVNDVNAGTVTDTTYTASKGVMLWSEYNGSYEFSYDNFKETVYYTTSTWESDVYNTVSVSTWSSFGATDQSNGTQITYAVRVGSNTGAVAARSYVTITPGSLIAGTTDQVYVQVRAQGVSAALNYGEVQDITVNYVQGGAQSNTIYGASWQNRYWVTASTGASSTNNVAVVKSRAPTAAWIPYTLDIAAMVRYNDYFYAGASTHSAIYRLDHGTNDDGRPILPHWETRDELWEHPSRSKKLQEINVDFERNNAPSTLVSWSRDAGVTYSSRTVNMSGTGRANKRLLVNGGNSHTFRFQISNPVVDEDFKIFGLDAYAVPYEFRQ